MNDFTKEELERILLRSYAWVGHPENQKQSELELIKKIQSMIDNYCEHDDVCPSGMIHVLCRKCGKMVRYQ